MKRLFFVLVLLALIGGLPYALGRFRPSDHVARCRATYASAPDELFATIADLENWAEWNSAIEGMERQADRDGKQAWLTRGSWGAALTEVETIEPPHKLVTFVDAGSFSGRWIFEVAPFGTGASLTITEEGKVDNAFFRGLMVLMLHDNYESMKTFMTDLGTRLGEQVAPTELR